MLMDYKGAGKSVTVWGAVATLAVALFGVFGVSVDSGTVVKGVEAGALVLSSAATIWGRVRATRKIG